ncbi:phage minor head protein [Pseudobacillus sp. FSL P4-0506]|uniref:phage minor head protein n=1 Tax=Pseudobacillus sp. FSL P4-0506 TaxID=2921576 RepID=UPI0030FA4FB3
MIDNERLQDELEEDQNSPEAKALAAALLAALSIQVYKTYRSYAKDGILSNREMNQRNRKKKFFQSISTTLASHYSQVKELVLNKALGGFKHAYGRYMEEYSKVVGWELGRELAEKTIQEQMKKGYPLNKTMTYNRRKTLKQLRRSFQEGWKKGETQDQLMKRVEEVIGSDKKRIKNIVKHETGRMQSLAQIKTIEKAKKKGVRIQTQWCALRDARTRPSHRYLHGQKSDEEGYFYVAGARARAPRLFGMPSEDCNCRCYLKIISISDSVDFDDWVEGDE